jgi:drug/metabolite transporter (DMT)-like permease
LFARAPIFDDWPETQRGLLFAFWRAAFAALVLLPTVRRPRFRPMLVPLAICFTLMNVTYLSAMILTTPANAIWLQSAAPWWVFLISVAVFREPVVRRDLIPLAFGMAGVGTILACEILTRPGQNLAGIACGLASGVAYGGVVFFMGRLNAENASWLVALNHAVAAAAMFPLVLYYGLWPSPVQLLVLAAFGVLQMALPYLLLIRGLRSIRAQEAVSIGLIEPVLMPLWTFLIWGVAAAWWTILGGALILTGLLFRYLLLDLRQRAWKSSAHPTKLGH